MINSVNSNYKAICKLFNFSKEEFLTYNELRKEIIEEIAKKPEKIINYQKEYLIIKKQNWPRHPYKYYKEWVNWYHLFGENKIELLDDYEKLREEVRKQKITSLKDYLKKRKKNWPANPRVYYKNQWTNGYDFLGINKKFLTYNQLKKELKKHKISSEHQYRNKRKKNWPSSPHIYYKEWIGWPDLFGREKIKYINYESLKKEVKKYKITTSVQYKKESKNKNWPRSPAQFYKEWTDWYDLLGRKKIILLNYVQLKKEVKKYKIKSSRQYAEKRKKNWPSNPYETYKNFPGWHDLLGLI